MRHPRLLRLVVIKQRDAFPHNQGAPMAAYITFKRERTLGRSELETYWE